MIYKDYIPEGSFETNTDKLSFTDYVPEPKPIFDDSVEAEKPIEELSKSELIDIARSMNIEVGSKMTKADLVEIIGEVGDL